MKRALVAMMLGALLPLLRVLADPVGLLPGDELGDVYKHAWSFWHATVAPGLWTDFLNAPDGGMLFDVMWLPSRLLIPVTWLAGPVLASNLWVWGSLVAVGMLTWAAARELSEGPWAPIAAGLLTQTAPFLMGYPLFSGVHERLAVWVFPLLFIGLSRVAQRGDLRWALACVLGLGAAVSGCQVYGPYAVLQIGLMAPWLFWTAWKAGQLPRLLGTLGLMAASMLGLAWLTVWAAEHPQSLSPQPGRAALGLGVFPVGEPASLDLMLDPMAVRGQQLLVSGDRLAKTMYLGWVPLLLGVAGALWSRRTPALLGVGVALVAAVCALGPLDGWNLPYVAAAWTVPALGAQPNLWQLLAVFTPLMALGVAAFLGRLPRGWQLPASALVLTAVLVERGLVNPIPLVQPTAPGRVAELYAELPEGPVVEIPRAWRGGDGAHGGIFLAQTVHEQPLGVAVNIGTTGLDRYAPVLDAESEAWSGAAFCMRMGGFRSMVLHRSWLFTPGVAETLAADPGVKVLADDGELLLVELGEPQPTGKVVLLETGGSAEEVRKSRGGCPWE